MFSLLLRWMLTVDNCSDTKPMTPTSTTWSNQNIIDWPVRLCTLQEQKEVLWRTPTTWLHAWPGMVRRPITSIAGGVMWWGNWNADIVTNTVLELKSPDYGQYITHHFAKTRKSLSCHVHNQAETDTTSELPDAVLFASSLGQACAPFEWFVYFVWWVQHSCPN